MPGHEKSHALDHIVVVLFENRSLDNVLGHLYGPEDGKNFDGVVGKDLSNPIPEWAEHGAERKVVPYTVATDMDSPNPDSGEEYFHTNTQLYNTIDDHNRFKIGEAVTAPWNAPPPGATPTMDGFVTDYISTFTGEIGRQPTYDEYAHIMTGYTPEQLPGAQRDRAGLRRLRPLVLRGAVPDLHEPLVLDGGHLVGLGREQPGREVVHEERRRDALRAARGARQDLEGLRHGADAAVVHRRDPLSATEGPTGHPLRALRRVRAGRRGRLTPGLLAHRAEHGRGPR